MQRELLKWASVQAEFRVSGESSSTSAMRLQCRGSNAKQPAERRPLHIIGQQSCLGSLLPAQKFPNFRKRSKETR
eukprot:5749973-Amphidinium_carterae.1